jgi:hypothetical protein
VLSKILAGQCISDHHPILAICQDTIERQFPSRYRLNTSVLKDDSKRKVLQGLVVKELAFLARKNIPPVKQLKLTLIRSTKQTRCWGKSAALKQTMKERQLRGELAAAQIVSEGNPEDASLYASWQDKETAVRNLEEAKTRWITERSRRYNIQAGKLGHKHVYLSFKTLAKGTQLTGLEDEDGIVYDSWNDMERITVRYFEKLFSSDDRAEEAHIDYVLDRLNLELSEEDREYLNALFTGEELLEALKGLGKNKSPGPHGIPAEFYLAFWKELEAMVVETLNAGMVQGKYSREFLKSLITLLHKKGNPMLLKNKRGISLTNVSYKIGAKAMQKRLTKVLMRKISREQYAYLPGRSIHHGMLLANEMVDRARSLAQPYVWLKVDVIKAFDKME